MKLRPERPFTSLFPRDCQGHPLGYGGVGMVQHYVGATKIWRYGDEPGVYRDDNGKILADDKVRSLVPNLETELEQRALFEDKETVAREVQRLLAGGATEVIAEQGPYALVSVKGGGLVNITKNGVNIHGVPLPEQMARAIFKTLTPAPVSLAPVSLTEAVRAVAA